MNDKRDESDLYLCSTNGKGYKSFTSIDSRGQVLQKETFNFGSAPLEIYKRKRRGLCLAMSNFRSRQNCYEILHVSSELQIHMVFKSTDDKT